MKLYSLHAKPVPLAITQFDNRLDLFACGSDDKKSVVVFVVNPTRDPVEFVPGFGGFDPIPRVIRAETVCDVLNRRQPDVENHWHEPERVRIVSLPVTEGAMRLPPLSATAIECAAD
jgi:hypothetical protein